MAGRKDDEYHPRNCPQGDGAPPRRKGQTGSFQSYLQSVTITSSLVENFPKQSQLVVSISCASLILGRGRTKGALMSYQFIHVETYSKKGRATRENDDQYNSVEQVFGEAARDERYSRHVGHVMEVLHLAGTMTLAELRATWERRVNEIRETVKLKDGKTYERRLKSDADTLYTEIHSHPMTVEEFQKDAGGIKGREMREWVQRALKDFKRRMPEGIDYTAVMHIDEAHIHFHIIAINTPDPKLDANKLHAGKAAAAKVRASAEATTPTASLPKPALEPAPKKPKQPKPSKNRATQKKNDEKHAASLAAWETECREVAERNKAVQLAWQESNRDHLISARRARGTTKEVEAYGAAMKTLQDDYYKHVGAPCGLLRDGPRRARKSTMQHSEDKRQAKVLADMKKEAEKKQQAVIAVANVNASYQEELEEKERSLNGRAEALKAREAHLWSQEKALAARTAEVAKAESELREGFAAMEAIVTGLEDGSARVRNGRLHLTVWPVAVKKALDPDAPRTPLTHLLTRFARFITRAWTAIDRASGAEQNIEERPEPR